VKLQCLAFMPRVWKTVERQLDLLAKYDVAVLTKAWVCLSVLYCNTF